MNIFNQNDPTPGRPAPGRAGAALLLVCLLLPPGGGIPAAAAEDAMAGTDTKPTRHIVLLGASVGRAWEIQDLPARIGVDGYSFEYVGEYAPDKSGMLASILGRAGDRPDAVIIKECAAYFPDNAERLKTLVPGWVASCRESGVTPVLATVVPVVRSFGLRIFIYNLLHGKWGYPRGTFGAIIAFNDWVRQYAAREGLVVLDLEAALRTSDTDRHLNGRYARRDGMHLNARAYRELDAIVIPAVSKVAFPD